MSGRHRCPHVTVVGASSLSGRHDYRDVIVVGRTRLLGRHRFRDMTIVGTSPLSARNRCPHVTVVGTSPLLGRDHCRDVASVGTSPLTGRHRCRDGPLSRPSFVSQHWSSGHCRLTNADRLETVLGHEKASTLGTQAVRYHPLCTQYIKAIRCQLSPMK